MLFLGQLRFSCGLSFILLMWCIRLIDFWPLNHLFIPGINPTGHVINPLCVAGFGFLIFSGFFVSIFVNNIGL